MLETVHVELLWLHGEHVAGHRPPEARDASIVLAQRLPQRRQMDSHRRGGGDRCPPDPQPIDQRIDGDGPVAGQQHHRKQGSGSRRQRYRTVATEDRNAAQRSESHACNVPRAFRRVPRWGKRPRAVVMEDFRGGAKTRGA
jgi:hypothetical protein